MEKWIVDSKDDGARLLTFVKERCKDFSTKDVRFAIEHNRCKVNGVIERFGSRRLLTKDQVELALSTRPKFEFEKGRVLYDDPLFLVYNKPAGVSSEDLATNLSLLLVHRLDRDTTGVFVLAKDEETKSALEALFRQREMQKSYLAIVCGVLKDEKGIIENQVGKIGSREGSVTWGVVQKGIPAVTQWKRESKAKSFSLMRCIPVTGRTHQIRVHLSHMGYPILGDLQYGKRQMHAAVSTFRPMLHAETLAFPHPKDQRSLLFKAPLPSDFREALLKCSLS